MFCVCRWLLVLNRIEILCNIVMKYRFKIIVVSMHIISLVNNSFKAFDWLPDQ